MENLEKSRPKWKTWHKVTIGILAAFLVLIIIAINSGSQPAAADATASSSDAPTSDSTAKKIKVGDILHTEFFDVTINAVMTQTSIKLPADQEMRSGEGNQYLELAVTLKNTDKEDRTMFTGGTVLINVKGTEYKYEDAETVDREGFGLIYEKINPMVTKTTILVYKIPTGLDGDVYYRPGRAEDNQIIYLGKLKDIINTDGAQ
jgi:hypothetical protein